MCDYFCNFIRSGDPNGKDRNGENLPRWQTWTEKMPCTMRFETKGSYPDATPLPPLEAFLSARILDRIRSL